MDAPPSSPRPGSPELRVPIAPNGTLLGLAPIQPVTIRVGDTADPIPYEVDFWSAPPPDAFNPIIPCEEPDDEDVYQWRPLKTAMPVFRQSVVEDRLSLTFRSDSADHRFIRLLTAVIAVVVVLAVCLRLAL